MYKRQEQYDIVGKYLLLAIKEVLGTAATPEIVGAWAEAYKAIAGIFIDVESNLYKQASWASWKPFVVTEKKYVSDEVVEFVVNPVEGSGIDLSKLKITPGQYLSLIHI